MCHNFTGLEFFISENVHISMERYKKGNVSLSVGQEEYQNYHRIIEEIKEKDCVLKTV